LDKRWLGHVFISGGNPHLTSWFYGVELGPTTNSKKNINYILSACKSIVFCSKFYSLRPKLYDVLGISHVLRNVINFLWERDIMSCFTNLSLINDMGKINERKGTLMLHWYCKATYNLGRR